MQRLAVFRPEDASVPSLRQRLSGEDAPTWLPAAFALIGTFVAIAAGWLALNAQSSLHQPEGGNAGAQRAATAVSPEPATAAPSPAPLHSGTMAMKAEPAGSGALSSGAPTAALRPVASEPVETSAPTAAKDCPPVVTIPFDRNSSRPVVADAGVALEALQAYLGRHPQAKLAVEGHADSAGRANHNLLLSYRRAKAVMSLLARAGVAEERMVLSASGAHSLVDGVPGDSRENRRVVLQVKGAEGCQGGPRAGVQR